MKVQNILIIVLLLIVSSCFSQTLISKSRGRVFNSENQKLDPDEVKTLLASKPELLTNYEDGRNQKITGNILLGAGIGFVVGDLFNSLYNGTPILNSFTYVGLAAIVVSVPIKIGYKKRIRNAVEGYNKQLVENNSKIRIENAALYANQNGLGFRFTF